MVDLQRLPRCDLGARLDAEFYRAALVENERRLSRAGFRIRPLGELVVNGRRTLYMGTETRERGSAPADWVPFLTSEDLASDGFFVNLDSRRLVAPQFADRYASGRLRSAELLVKVKGPNQTAAFVASAPAERVLVSGTIWGGVVRAAEADAHFLVAVLCSSFGVLARTRRTTNTNVEFVAPSDLLAVPVPVPHPDAQAYIGSKVRQAEALRERARTLEATVGSVFSPFAPASPTHGLSWRTHARWVEAYRLNASHYEPQVLVMIARAKEAAELVPLAELVDARGITGGATPLGASYADSGVLFVRVQNVKPLRLGLADAVYIDTRADQQLRRSRCEAGDVILSITGYPGVASLVMPDDLPVNINQHSVRFAVHPPWLPGYVAAAINSTFVNRQVDRLAIGGTRDALDYPSVGSLLIPRLPTGAMAEVHNQVVTANAAARASQRLTTAARLFVEALIERKVTEADLIAAHRDPVHDRELLSRVSLGGIDIHDQPPLFPDLDALFGLVAGATEPGGRS